MKSTYSLRVVGTCLGLVVAGCSSSPARSVDPLSTRPPTRFALAALLAEEQVPVPRPFRRCAVPVRGAALPDGAPEVGLTATLSRVGGTLGVAKTDDGGIAALTDLALGAAELSSVSGDKLLRAELRLDLQARRTEVRGALQRDAEDQDGDGDRDEWVMAIEVLPDGDGDGISDNGERAFYSLGADGGVGWRHLFDGMSEKFTVDSEFIEGAAVAFNDRDGDFIADEVDLDADGDGIPDADEPAPIACPGFSHAQLSTPGSKHAGFSCDRCHQTADHLPLQCADCHSPSGKTPTAVPATSPAGHFAAGCDGCHVPDKAWAVVPGATGNTHASYPLTGKHLATDCFACHVGGERQVPTLCEACHLRQAPLDHPREACLACHLTAGWLPPLATHDALPLKGAHAGVACAACHSPSGYGGLNPACASCHASKAPPKHASAGFSAQPCDLCHNATAWAAFRWQHTAWLFDGKHLTVLCADCHKNDPTSYRGLRPVCSTCHTPPVFPDHSDATVFGTDCELCHVEAGWVPATRNVTNHAVWPLVGAHVRVRCSICHQSGALLHPPHDCVACHEATRPARHAGTFDGDCSLCHQPSAWAALLTPYVHPATFVLNGAHASVSCATCHPVTYPIAATCVSCHAKDRPANHYGDGCAGCHTTTNWLPTGNMNHHTAAPTAFRLLGAHATLACSKCHPSGFAPIPRACESCHTSRMPVGHATDSCANCHTSGSWANANPPPANAMHPLAAAHTLATCVQCHGAYLGAGVFTKPRPATACSTCHALPSGHLATGGAECNGCHTLAAWLPATGGGHVGAVAATPFPYNTWSGAWFPATHGSAKQCNRCHTLASNLNFFSCTTNCHTSVSAAKHKGMSTFHLDPNAVNSPPNQGGATWPTAHVGCVQSTCHPKGKVP